MIRFVTRGYGQPDETGKSGGQPPIKIKLKRLANTLRPHSIYGVNKPLHPTPEHSPADMHPHGPYEESPANLEMDAIMSGCPFTYTGTPDLAPDYGISDSHGHAGNPDSTSDSHPHIDTGRSNDTHVTGVHTAVDQMQEGEVDSSFYRNISMWVEAITSSSKEPRCLKLLWHISLRKR